MCKLETFKDLPQVAAFIRDLIGRYDMDDIQVLLFPSQRINISYASKDGNVYILPDNAPPVPVLSPDDTVPSVDGHLLPPIDVSHTSEQASESEDDVLDDFLTDMAM